MLINSQETRWKAELQSLFLLFIFLFQMEQVYDVRKIDVQIKIYRICYRQQEFAMIAIFQMQIGSQYNYIS